MWLPANRSVLIEGEGASGAGAPEVRVEQQGVADEKPWWRDPYGMPPWDWAKKDLPIAVWAVMAVVAAVAIVVGLVLPVPYLAPVCGGFFGMSVANLLRIRERRRRLMLSK